MNLRNYILALTLFCLPLRATDLEFLVLNESSEPLPQSSVVLQGISDPDSLYVQETNNQGSTTFSVDQGDFFYYFAFKQGFHPEGGAILSDQNKITELNLVPFLEGQWQYYYRTNGQLELSFLSSDPDTDYEILDPFNYEIECGSVSNEEVHLTSQDINSGIYSENGNPVMVGDAIWGSPNEEIIYDIYFRPRSGWLRYIAQGNNVTATIGESYGTFNGINFDVSGDGEFVTQQITTNDNVVPNNIENGFYHVLVNILGLSMTSQNFHVNAPVSIVTTNQESNLEKEILAYPNPFNGKFNILGYDHTQKIEIYNLKGEQIYCGSLGKVNIGSYPSGTYIGVIDEIKFPLTQIK